MSDTTTSVLVDLEGLAYYTAKQDLKNNNKFAEKASVQTVPASMTANEATTGTETGSRVISPKVLSDFVEGKVSGIVNSAPAALDTLKELADALGNDENFATTVTNALAGKVGNDAVYRKPSTAYALGDFVYLTSISNGKKLVCVKAGTTANSALAVSSTAEGALITDGTVTWMVDSLADGNYDAAHQNGIYRGADLTAYWNSGLMSTNIQSGKFVGIHIGDYITKSVTLPAITYTDKAGTEQTQAAQTFNNVKWYVAAIDPHIHCGDTETTAHHVLLIPASTLQRNVKMNPTNDTTGAYTGSDMWRVHMPNWANAIKTAFGSGHVLKHRELLANAINATAPSGAGAGWVGTASGWAWTDVEVNIPNEQMIYGGRVWGSGFDGGNFPHILPLYALKCRHIDDRSWFWLRAVASASNFADAGGTGDAGCFGASGSGGGGGVRPYFLAH